ncbi:MAG: family 43 glycosylhydrolase [Treponema sp.]|jgi:arabinoxylan arabinofuranohydrolase|nr:family 43 glycosylhydrolase [Treponema sp.]
MKTNERFAVCRIALAWLFALVLVFLPGCENEDSSEKEQWKDPPPEAALFTNLKLTTPLKDYSHGNPLMTQEFGADPNILVWEGRVYVYMTADSFIYSGGQVIDMAQNYGHIQSFRVLSSADLVNWTQHPDIKKSDITRGNWISNLWAPAPVAKEVNGQEKIFLYFSNNTNTAVISADDPLGPWTSPRSNALLSSSTPNTAGVGHIFDPGVLIDDDGRAYIYFGGATPSGGDAVNYDSNHPRPKNMRVVELGEDMTSIIGTPVLLDIPFTFEASEINKINGKYYYSYSSNPQVTRYRTMPDDKTNPSGWTSAQIREYAEKNGESMSIGYAISDKPLPNQDGTGFELTGMVMPNPGTMFEMGSNNNHHKIFQFKDKWYIVYHTHLLSDALFPSKDWNYRSTSIDKVTIKTDGKIETVKGTRTGVKQVGYFDPYQPVNAATMAVMAGISTTEVSGERRMKVTDIDSGDWIALRGVDFGNAGAKKFSCHVMPPVDKGVIQIKLDGLKGKAIGYIIIEAGESEITVELLTTVTGVHDVVFIFHGKGYDFEEWQFIR